MDKNGFFGEMLEKGQQAVTSSVKTVASDVASQIGLKTEASPDAQGVGQNQGQTTQTQQQQSGEATQVQAASTDETKQFVKEFYAPSVELPENLTPELQQQMQQEDQIESQQKLANLRHELHKSEYYDPLIAHETKKPEEEEDENAAKRVEKQEQEEEQEKMQLEEKKAKGDQDIAKTRAQTKTEANRGAMG
jgi:hypothetical protein